MRLHLLFGIVFVLLAFCGMPFAINYVACGDALDTANTIYAMNVSSSSIETCFNVSAENVTLDCAGFSITGEGTRNGIYSDQFNTTIGNCTISNFDAPILFNGATYGTINNVTLEVSVACESACAGIDLDFESDNNQISDITIVSPSPDGIGIYLSESANNKFSRVNITAGYSGIYFNPSPNNTFTNFTIRSLLFAGVYIYHSPNNTISNSVISSTDSFGIYVLASNSINNQILNSTIFSTTNYSIMLEYDASNNSFLGNNITSDLWISDDAGGNFFNDSTSGNIWNTANGTPAADLFDITSSMGTWADGGTSLPLSEASVPDYWSGAGEDGHPWVGGGISCLPEMSLSQADMPAVLACAGSTYTLTENVSIAGSGALTVSAENVSIDCAGYSITGNNSTATYGIYSDQFNTTIKNCGVSNFHHGIYFNSARNGTIQDTNSSSTRASGYGIYLYNGSNYNTVSNAIISADCDSLCIGLSSYNTISNTVVSGHCDTITVQTSPNNIFINTTSTATAGSALYISSSPGATISNSSFTGTYDLYFYNSCFASFANNTGTGGKPIIYANAAANIVSADAAVIIACNISSGLNITASNASSGGIVLYRVNSSSISGSSAATAGYNDAISLIFSSGNTISNTNSTSSVSSALYLDSSSGNIFSGLSLSTASNAGAIRFSTSTNNTISASTVSATNGKAVSFISSSGNQVLNSTLSSSGGYGAYLSSSSGNVFLQNTITSPTWVSDDIGGNTFNNSIVGNKYYLANGTGAWEIYDIVDTNGDGWADIGSDLPFNSSLIGEEWYGYGEDYHPYSFTVAPTAAIYANSWSISYGQSATINCSIDNSQSTLTLYQDNSAINSSTGSNFSTIVSSLAVGAYNFTCNATASENYTASNSASGILTVNQIADTISLALNGTEANLSATYSPALSFPVNASSTTGTHTHYLNGSGISDNYTATLAAGIYNFTAISSGNENYSAATKSFFATISKAASTLTLATNSPVNYLQPVSVNCSIDNSQTAISLYRNGSLVGTSTSLVADTSMLAAGTYNFTCNATASENYTASNSASGILTVNRITDTISLALNGTEANLSATYSPSLSFPVNASSTTGTHTLYLNGSAITDNYTALLAAGTYNFTAISSGNENYSAATKSFFATISKAPSALTLTTSSPVNYLQPVSVNCSIDNSQTAISLYRNGSLVGTSTSLVADTSMLAAGTYNYTCNASASENYTAPTETSSILTVNRITDTISLALNGTEANLSATYSPSLSFPVNASSTTGTHTLYLNGSAITDNYTALLAAGTYNFTAISSGNENYSAATKSFFATISKAPSALTLTTNSPVNYLQPVSVNCSIDNSQTAISLYRNGSLVGTSTLLVADTSLLAAGTYNYTCNASASMNYTAPTETSGIFTVNQIADTITLEINRSEANFSGVYGTPLNVSASSNSGTHQLYQNGVEISNPTDEMFAAGIYNFTANSSGNENYTSTVKSFFANISKASATATISANSWSIQYGLSATINCSIDNAQSNLSLYQDNTFINSSTDSNFSTLVSSLAAGAYNFTCNATASENYTASNSVSGLLTVDDAAPVLSIQVPLANSVLANNSNTSVLNFTAFDNGSGLDTSSCKYNVNGTNVSIGSCANGTQLSFTSDGVKTLTVYAKDMAGLEGDATISFMVNTAGENKSIINETTNASVNETIYVTPTSPASNITIALNATNVSLNITAYNSSISFNVTLPEINVNASTSLGNVLLSIPNGTVVSGASDWNGVIQLPSVRAATTFMPTNISGYTNTVQSTVEIGVADVEVNLSKAVRILIPGMAGQLAGFQRNNIFTAITNTCGADSQIWADANILTGSECKINNESDMVIWTKHFTLFGTYTQAVNSPSSGSSTNGGGSVGGGSGAGSSASTLPSASYNVDVGQGSACAVTITREMTSTTNLSTLTTTLENAGGSDCSMTDFVFADTIPSDFPALNEVAFNPQYSSRNGWAVSFNFPTFAAGESKTLTYSANKWIRTSIAKNFTAYTMAAEKKQAVVPAAPTVPTIPEEPSVWVPRKLPSLPNEQPAAAPSATPTAPSEGNQGIFRLVIVLGAIAIVAGTVLFFVLKGRKKKEK